jgi:hypothetical protein
MTEDLRGGSELLGSSLDRRRADVAVVDCGRAVNGIIVVLDETGLGERDLVVEVPEVEVCCESGDLDQLV